MANLRIIRFLRDLPINRKLTLIITLISAVTLLIASHDITLIEELDYPVLSLDHGRLALAEADIA